LFKLICHVLSGGPAVAPPQLALACRIRHALPQVAAIRTILPSNPSLLRNGHRNATSPVRWQNWLAFPRIKLDRE
jgi:hypothetical protein